MSLDGMYLSLIKEEVSLLAGCRVDKVHQPSRDEIVLSFRADGGVKKLLLSANPSNARVHMTETVPENPKTPYMFCMLMRKHIQGGKLISVTQSGLERILNLDFLCSNEIGDTVTNRIAAEIMGKSSNIVLVSVDTGKITDAIRRVPPSADCDVARIITGGVKYYEPKRECRADFRNIDAVTAVNAVTDAVLNKEEKLCKVMLRAFEGISPLFARECACYVSKDVDLRVDTLLNTKSYLDRFCFFLKNVKIQPTMLCDRAGVPKDFCFTSVHQYGSEYVSTSFESASALLEKFYSEKAAKERVRQRAGGLLKTLMNTTERISRKLSARREELAACKDRGRMKLYGDLINANLYRYKSNMNEITVRDYNDDKDITIALDPRKSVAENAQRYYSEYKKSASAEIKLKSLIEEGEKDLIYIDGVFDAVSRTANEAELAEIRGELIQTGFYKLTKKDIEKSSKKRKSSSDKLLPFMKFISSDGFTILAGRNNLQNDRLTLKTAKSDDFWLHTKDIAGSHVVILAGGESLPENTVTEAAVIAAYCSKGRNSGNVPVDCTKIRYVKKPAGAKPGMVIFTHNRTLYVTPSEEMYNKFKVN